MSQTIISHHVPRLGAVALIAWAVGSVWAQADYFEGFESNGPVEAGQFGPVNLINAGWIFRNQSNPVDGPAWSDGLGLFSEPFEGGGYLTTSGDATSFFGGQVSSWALLPDIPGLIAGDMITVWISGGGAFDQPTTFEIRLSDTGLSTGTGPTATGDFDQVLYIAELPVTSQGYSRVSVPIPSAGRLALRFSSPWLMNFAGGGAELSIDPLTVGPEGDSPCGLNLPTAGETVVWASGQTYTVCQDLTIPAGATLEIEPGAIVEIQSGFKFRIEGTLNASGTASSPVLFTGPNSFDTGLDIAGGADIAFADIGVNVQVGGEDATLILTDSSVVNGAELTGVPDLVVIERCGFEQGATLGGFAGLNGSIRVVDTTFADGTVIDVGGLLHIDGVTADNAPVRLSSETWAYPVLIENLTATNNTSGPGLTIGGRTI